MENDKKDISFSPNIPVVTSLNSYTLEKAGFKKGGNVYTKGDIEVKYDGVYWWQGENKVECLEDIENNKTPGENRG